MGQPSGQNSSSAIMKSRQFACAVLLLGALLLTGYLGGAVATHVRVQNPLFSHVLFPIYLSVLLWGGLILRDARLRALVPIRRLS